MKVKKKVVKVIVEHYLHERELRKRCSSFLTFLCSQYKFIEFKHDLMLGLLALVSCRFIVYNGTDYHKCNWQTGK
jgi:hypothetical protein